MRSQKGITLTSLVIYVIVMAAVIGLMGAVINTFYQNTDNIQKDTQDIIEFNNFNTYLLKEIKKKYNKIDSIKDNYVLFTSGNSFSLVNESICYNNIEICKGVKGITVKQGINGDGVDDTVIYITINFENFSKSMNYKIEEIY